MRANRFTGTDGLLVIATDIRRFAFRPQIAKSNDSNGTRVNAEPFRKTGLRPPCATTNGRARLVAAANGLETAG